MNLKNTRIEIDEIDRQIHDLLNQRAELALKVGSIKMMDEGTTDNFYRPEREQEILSQISAYNKGPLDHKAVHRIFRQIMNECLHLEYQTYNSKQNL